ncbi:hypothetical protein GCM10027027_04050 [Neomicrococcus lactis]
MRLALPLDVCATFVKTDRGGDTQPVGGVDAEGSKKTAQRRGDAAANGAAEAAAIRGSDQAIPLDTVRRLGALKPVSDMWSPTFDDTRI